MKLMLEGTSVIDPPLTWIELPVTDTGLIALLNEKLGRPVGFLQPVVYALPESADAFNDITSGSNGAFSAGPGWDPTTGLGSPSGENLLQALSKESSA